MKNLLLFLALVCSALLLGCSYPQGNSTTSSGNVTTITRHLKPGKHCYMALFEKDSASLTFTITAAGKINGQLNINYNTDTLTTRQPTAGTITGEFKGDTLFADYYFTSGANGKEKYINPIALLFKNDTLVMGHGKIYYYLGRTYFDDKTPIDFNKSRFRFVPTNCR